MITSRAQNSPPSLVSKNFSQTFVTFLLFSRDNSFQLSFLGNLSTTKFAICILKARLGGEISLSDVSMHMGYFFYLVKFPTDAAPQFL